jgi:LacI family transcriptional regulator
LPTLEEIAKLSQVSRSTVSRVINNDPHVSAPTRERVMAVVQQLDYQPNAVARSLAAGRTQILGLIIPAGLANTFHDPFFPVFIRSVVATCSARDYSVMLWLAEPDDERRLVNQVLRNGMLDGLIVTTMHLPEEIVDALLAAGLPFVFAGRYTDRRIEASYVDVENRRGAQEAVTHLLRLGCRRVAHITGPLDTTSAQDRLQGYKDALRSRGMRWAPELVAEGDFTESTGYFAMQTLLSLDFDALFAANDLTAMGAIRALREAGRRVPEDVAVVGFDDIAVAASADPPLTTVRQPSDRMGAVATETLIDMIDHDDAFLHRVVLPTELVIRGSCGAMVRD